MRYEFAAMYDASRPLLYALLAIPALIVGAFALLVALSLGPLGFVVVVLLGIGVTTMIRTWFDEEAGTRSADRTNCPDCGAPNPAEAESCEYCESPLAGA